MNRRAFKAVDSVTGEQIENGLKTAITTAESITVPTTTIPKYKVISGFHVADGEEVVPDHVTAKRKADADARVTELKQMQRDRVRLRTKLEAEGLAPLAIIPIHLWNGLCRQFGLVRFESLSEQGETGAPGIELFAGGIMDKISCVMLAFLGLLLVPVIATSWISALTAVGLVIVTTILTDLVVRRMSVDTTKEFTMFLWVAALSELVGTTVLASLAVKSPSTLLWSGVVGFLVLVFFSLLLGGKEGERKMASWISGKVLARMPHTKLAGTLFPEGKDCESNDKGNNITVRFPEPPSEVASVLHTAEKAGWDIHVAADPLAISFDHAQIKRRMEEAIQRDPVVYLTSGGMVVVLAQFGEFPSEKALVEATQSIGVLPS